MADALSIDVFNGGYKPIPGGPGWDDHVPATWPASTSTCRSLLTISSGVCAFFRLILSLRMTAGHFTDGPLLRGQVSWLIARLSALRHVSKTFGYCWRSRQRLGQRRR